MNKNNSNILLLVVIVLTMVMLGVGNKVLVDKIANQVIQKLQKEYSPSPYGPGIDPDKLDLEKLKKESNAPLPPFKAIQPVLSEPVLSDGVVSNWNDDWESQRK